MISNGSKKFYRKIFTSVIDEKLNQKQFHLLIYLKSNVIFRFKKIFLKCLKLKR